MSDVACYNVSHVLLDSFMPNFSLHSLCFCYGPASNLLTKTFCLCFVLICLLLLVQCPSPCLGGKLLVTHCIVLICYPKLKLFMLRWQMKKCQMLFESFFLPWIARNSSSLHHVYLLFASDSRLRCDDIEFAAQRSGRQFSLSQPY